MVRLAATLALLALAACTPLQMSFRERCALAVWEHEILGQSADLDPAELDALLARTLIAEGYNRELVARFVADPPEAEINLLAEARSGSDGARYSDAYCSALLTRQVEISEQRPGHKRR